MIKLDRDWLTSLGVNTATEEEASELLARCKAELEVRTGVKILNNLNEAQIAEFKSITDESNKLPWLERAYPDYPKIVSEEYEAMGTEIKNAPDKVATIRGWGANVSQNTGQPASQSEYVAPPSQKTDLSGKVTLKTQYEANVFLCQFNAQLSSQTSNPHTTMQKGGFFSKFFGRKASNYGPFEQPGYYVVSSIAHEPDTLFDTVRAWSVQRVRLPIEATSDGKVKGANSLGDYGYYLTENGYLLNKGFPGVWAKAGNKENFYKLQYNGPA